MDENYGKRFSLINKSRTSPVTPSADQTAAIANLCHNTVCGIGTLRCMESARMCALILSAPLLSALLNVPLLECNPSTILLSAPILSALMSASFLCS